MKPSIMKVIRYDYLSTLLFIVSVVFTIVVILIIALGETSVLFIGLIFIGVGYGCLIIRVSLTRNEILRLKDSRINAQVHKIDQNNGNFYIVVNYEVKTRSLGKRIPILAGPILRAKLRKLKEVQLLVDMEKPKKIYIADFYY